MPGTCTSRSGAGPGLEAFRDWADRVWEERGVGVELARIAGPRWAFLAGPRGPLPLAAPVRVHLGADLGALLHGALPQDSETWREEILQVLRGDRGHQGP